MQMTDKNADVVAEAFLSPNLLELRGILPQKCTVVQRIISAVLPKYYYYPSNYLPFSKPQKAEKSLGLPFLLWG